MVAAVYIINIGRGGGEREVAGDVLLLLEQAPETREEGLLVLAERCPKWAALVNVWDLLSETLRSEIGDTLPPYGSAPKTYALMEEALDSAIRS